MDVGFQYHHSKQNQRFFDIIQELRGLLMPIKGYENMPLVSLEESVFPLVSILPDIHTYVFMAKDNNSTSPTEGLTLDESASICLYSIECEPHDQCLSRALNRTLRSKDRQKLYPWYLYLKLILTALTHLPSIANQIIYRGIKLDLSQDYPEGKIFIWWGFSSCTSSLSVLESIQFIGKIGIRTMFKIECHSGKNISKHTYFQSEEEVLILPATRFIVISYENHSNSLYIIHLKEIPPPFPLLEPIIDSNAIAEKKHWSIEHGILHQQCTIVDLTGNEITLEGAILLANALNNNLILKELILFNNRIDDKGIRAISLELSINNSILKKLNLGLNDITDDGAQHLAQMLKTNRTLTHLWLQQNHLGDRGLQLLAGVLARQNWTLEFLNLFSNKFISDLSVPAVTDMLQLNQSLQKLDMYDCNLTETSEMKLQELIKTKKDFELII